MRGWDYGDKSKVGQRLELLDIHQTAKVERLVSHLRAKNAVAGDVTVWRSGFDNGTVGLSWTSPAGTKHLVWMDRNVAITRVLVAPPVGEGPDNPYMEEPALLEELRTV